MNPQPGLPALVLALTVGLGACEVHSCPDVGCATQARLTGTIPAPEATAKLDVEYCSSKRCITGQISVAAADARNCIDGYGGSSVCLERRGDQLEVEAVMSGDVPREGDVYTLRLVELESSQVLCDEARTAHVTTTHDEDECLTCTNASMNL